MADVERLARKEVAYGLLQDEPRRPLVDADAGEKEVMSTKRTLTGVYIL